MHDFTPRQIAWARRHDWFAGLDPKGVRVREVVVCSGVAVAKYRTFINYRTLRAAVGY